MILKKDEGKQAFLEKRQPAVNFVTLELKSLDYFIKIAPCWKRRDFNLALTSRYLNYPSSIDISQAFMLRGN